MLTVAIALLSATIIGYAAHRASLCNVRAVAELIHSGTAHTLWSLAQATLWAATLAGVLVLAFGVVPHATLAHVHLGWAAAGGALFGLGAAFNGGCSLSTVHRLVDGEAPMLATLFGLAGGAIASSEVQRAFGGVPFVALETPWLRWPGMAAGLLLVLAAWSIWRTASLLRVAFREHYAPPVAAVLWPSREASVVAAAMGLAAGALYAIEGAWTYTSLLRTTIQHPAPGTAPSPLHWSLVGVALFGMLVSSWQRRSFRMRAPTRAAPYLRHLAAGLLMGIGASLIPGGNDTLLLSSLPGMTASAGVAYVSMLAGIAAGLHALSKWFVSPSVQQRCCERDQPRPYQASQFPRPTRLGARPPRRRA